MILFNPTENHIKVQIFGVEYEIEPKGKSRDIPEEVAIYWRTKLHNFLIVGESKEEAVEVKAQDKKKKND